MSRAGKFIPGGGGAKTRTGPIRAPAPGSSPDGPSSPAGGKKPYIRASLVKPVAKNQRLPIAIMSGIVCCLLVSVGWYTLAYLPTKRSLILAQQATLDAQKKLADEQAAQKKATDDAATQVTAPYGALTLDSNPTGALVTVGDFRQKTPAAFKNIAPGAVSVTIRLDGYEDYTRDVTVTADKPMDLGTIQLTPQAGTLSLTSPQSNVTYTITGPGNFTHDGQLPDKLEKLPVGDYLITAAQGDWKLPTQSVTIHDRDTAQKEIKFPYAKLSIVSTPPGATVRQGHTVLGQTPLSIDRLHPGPFHVSVDLPPYALQRLDLQLEDFADLTKRVQLRQDKDFIAACGMPMVWIPDGGDFWAGKYEVRQSDFETVTGNNPSSFRRPSRPVDSVSWDAAMAFCDTLNESERKAGKLPSGYHYTLPKESQWETYSADADLDQAATSRVAPLSSTQDVGASEPNKYGLYDTIGNVWEWCLDLFDDKGDHTLRGGCWLSSPENFPNAETRNGAAPKYADRFIGFRVVLVPN